MHPHVLVAKPPVATNNNNYLKIPPHQPISQYYEVMIIESKNFVTPRLYHTVFSWSPHLPVSVVLKFELGYIESSWYFIVHRSGYVIFDTRGQYFILVSITFPVH